MTTIINGSSPSITFSDSTTQTTAFTTGAVTQATIGTNVAGTGPAFSAYLPTANQSVTTSVSTKVTLSAEVFDTNSNFDSTTNYRFTPTVAGYYQISGQVFCNSGASSTVIVSYIYKNGLEYCRSQLNSTIGQGGISVSAVVLLNGTTDYVELYGLNTSTVTPVFQSGSVFTYFSGSLVRSA
jgi:hypothetical protein